MQSVQVLYQQVDLPDGHNSENRRPICLGLIIGSGTALVRGGPLGIFLGYSFVGLVCYMVMVALGEMAAYLPVKSGFAGYATRFVDPAFGFAVGWNYLVRLGHTPL